jgi:hypothetical protein
VNSECGVPIVTCWGFIKRKTYLVNGAVTFFTWVLECLSRQVVGVVIFCF